MSTLKQEIYKIVKKDETVVNGYDPSNPELEGAVFQCNFNAHDFSNEDFLGLEGGTSIDAGDLVRWSFVNLEGDEVTKGFKAQRSYELVKSQAIDISSGEKSLNELLLFEDEDSDLYKSGSKYFLRNFTVYGSVNLTSNTDFIKSKDLILADSLLSITTNSFRVGDVLANLYTLNEPAILEDAPSKFEGTFTAVTFSTSLETTINANEAGAIGNVTLTGDGTSTIGELATAIGASVDVSSNESLANAVLRFNSEVVLENGEDAVASSFTGTFTAVVFGTSAETTINSNTAGTGGNVVLTGDGEKSIGTLATEANATVDIGGSDATSSSFTGTFTKPDDSTSAEVTITADTAGDVTIILTGDDAKTVSELATAEGATATGDGAAEVLKVGETITISGGSNEVPGDTSLSDAVLKSGEQILVASGVNGTPSDFDGTFTAVTFGTSETTTITADTAGAGDITLTGDGNSTIGQLATAASATVDVSGNAELSNAVLKLGSTVVLENGSDATNSTFTGTFLLAHPEGETGSQGTSVTLTAQNSGDLTIAITGDGTSDLSTLAAAQSVDVVGDGSQVPHSGEVITVTGGEDAVASTFTGTFDTVTDSTSASVTITSDNEGNTTIVLTGDDSSTVSQLATASGATATGDGASEILKSGETITISGGSDATVATFTGTFPVRIESTSTEVSIVANVPGAGDIVLTGDDATSIADLAIASNATATGDATTEVPEAGEVITLINGSDAKVATFTGTFETRIEETGLPVVITANQNGPETITLTGDDSKTISDLAAENGASATGDGASQVLKATESLVLSGGRQARKATFTGTFLLESGATSTEVTITMNQAGDEDVTLTGNGESNLSALASDAGATIDSGDGDQLLKTGETITLTGGDAPETEVERAADVAFANHDGIRRFKGKSYFGIISGTSLVPDDTWFYFDGTSLLNGQLTSEQAENIGAGFFYNNTGGKLDFSDISAMGAFFVDQETITSRAEAGSPIVSYVIAGDTGGLQVGFAFSSAINAAIGADEYSELVPSLEYSNVSNESGFWNNATSFNSPVLDISAEVLESSDPESLLIVDADILTDPVYWDKISENFIEDKNVAVGSTGAAGAHPEGNYSGAVTPRTEVDTYQTIEIISRTNGTAVDNIKIETVIKHGISIGSTASVGLSGFTGADSVAVNSATEVKAVDDKTLEILGTSDKVIDSPVNKQNPILTKTNFTDIIWEKVDLPTTQQALIYKG